MRDGGDLVEARTPFPTAGGYRACSLGQEGRKDGVQIAAGTSGASRLSQHRQDGYCANTG